MSLVSKLIGFASTPQGRRAIDSASRKAKAYASDPKNREKIEQARKKFSGGSGTAK